MVKLNQIMELVVTAASHATNSQNNIVKCKATTKPDGSIVTEIDKVIEDFLCEKLRNLFPDSSLISEEGVREFNESSNYYFLIDPIDGTENYINKLPMWSVSVGILNSEMKPIAGCICAPLMNITAIGAKDIGLFCNGQRYEYATPLVRIDRNSCLMLSSRSHQYTDISSFVGNFRSLGCASLNLLFVALYDNVVAALQDNVVYAWDVAAAHAINSAMGCEFKYIDGKLVDYKLMQASNWKASNSVLATRPGIGPKLLPYLHSIKERQ